MPPLATRQASSRMCNQFRYIHNPVAPLQPTCACVTFSIVRGSGARGSHRRSGACSTLATSASYVHNVFGPVVGGRDKS